LARLYVWLPRLPVAGAHVTPLEGGSSVGGHGDVFTERGVAVDRDLPIARRPDLLVLLVTVSLVHLLGPRRWLDYIHIALSGWSLGRHANDGNVFGSRQPTRTGLTSMLSFTSTLTSPNILIGILSLAVCFAHAIGFRSVWFGLPGEVCNRSMPACGVRISSAAWLGAVVC
jgi:hypothetical protein